MCCNPSPSCRKAISPPVFSREGTTSAIAPFEPGADGAAEQRAPFEDGEAVGKGEEHEGEVETDAGHRADERVGREAERERLACELL